MEIATLIISVLTLLTTIAGIVVSVVLYKKQKKDAALAELQRKKDDYQLLKDQQLSKSRARKSPFYGFGDCAKDLEESEFLKIRSRRI